MDSINTRELIPSLLTNKEGLVGVELGVAKGTFSKKIVELYNFKEFYLIDWWLKPNHLISYINLLKYKFKKETNVYILRGSFDEFLYCFKNAFFDFIYIDGLAHTGQLEGQTIRRWLPKIKKYGIISGHDYCDEYSKTKKYVDVVAEETNMKVNVVPEIGTSTHPSWYYTQK